MTSRVPPLLEPYLALPYETALVLLTGILGASTNWLVSRYLHALLKPRPRPPQKGLPSATSPVAQTTARDDEQEEEEQREVAVLLVSYLRDLAFWRESLGRLGVDLEGAARKGRFGYVDGLAALFSSGPGGGSTTTTTTTTTPPSGTGSKSSASQSQGWRRVLKSPGAGDMGREISEVVELLRRGPNADGSLRERKVVLVVDGLDFVLAASNKGEGDASAMAIREMLMDLREKTYAAIVTLAADDPLIKEQETTLEKHHAWFTLSLAHEADTVLSLRLLDTGAAKDVSGVLRITHGGNGIDIKDQEYLYHVGGDGSVRVFERGQ
ncbi:hypothetical protein VTK56DRAFT_8624 [Thermocarpiscus australiensis]